MKYAAPGHLPWVNKNLRRLGMWKNRLNRILNIIMGSVVGVFIGYGLYSVWDYKTHPGLYAMQSAPWYTGILTWGVFAAVVLLFGMILKLIIRKSGDK